DAPVVDDTGRAFARPVRLEQGPAERGRSAGYFFFFLSGSFLASGSVKKPLLTTSHLFVLLSTVSSGRVRYSRVVSPTRSLVRSLAKRRFLPSTRLTLSSSRKRSGAVKPSSVKVNLRSVRSRKTTCRSLSFFS